MAEVIGSAPVKRPRLKFIDIARSIAILLMLEGHFVDHTLGENFRTPKTIAPFTDNHYLAHDIWLLVRGYTSPLFLTVTGLVFVYLLYFSNDLRYTLNSRVKKGFNRVLELLFWGYLLNPRGFHVLQCIGFGIAGILLIYGIYKMVKVVPLWVYYLLTSLLIFSFWAPLSHHVDANGAKVPWPEDWPFLIQNMIWAPSSRSMFPLAPSLGYTFFGATIGVLLHSKWITGNKWSIPVFLGVTGAAMAFFIKPILSFLRDLLLNVRLDITWLREANWLLETLGWVLIVLGLLATFEKLVNVKENLFIRIGQNTLPIFVIHMIILYGAITRYGIGTFINRKENPLDPYEAAIGAALFLTLFIFFVKYIDPLKAFYSKVLATIIPWDKPVKKLYNRGKVRVVHMRRKRRRKKAAKGKNKRR
jgi:uncharacterized membrane protein